MRCVSLLNSHVPICFQPNNSAFMTHITVLYRFRSCLGHDFCIPSCLLTTGSAHLYLCTLGTRLHVSGNPLLCFPCIQYHEYFWTLPPRCVTTEPTPQLRRSGCYSLHVLSTCIIRTDRSSLHMARCRSMLPSTNFLSLQARTRMWSTGVSLG